MSAKTHNFRIGLFVLAAAALLVAALFAIGLKAYFGQHDIYETYVTGKVENLSVGALVKLRGVTIGKVSAIEFIGTEYSQFKEQYVLIQFEVPKGTIWSAGSEPVQKVLDQEIASGLRVRVQGQGLIGANILALEYLDPKIFPVEPIPWTPKHYYIPSAPSQIDSVLASLEKSLRKVEDLDLAQLLDRATTLINDANRLVDNVNQIDFKQLGTNATSLIVEFRETARDIQRTIADARTAINGADLPGISREASALVGRLSSAAIELRRVLASIDTGELNSSLANIRAATDELIVLLHNLEQKPSSLLFSKSPNPLPEMEKPPKK
jgi:ABC-type transporter Mla subunit MlaD